LSEYKLNRFVEAQETDYQTALFEIRSGYKRSHWMWYIFPQVAGLGFSETSRYYAIQDIGEASAYLRHPVLGARLIEVSSALLELSGDNATDIFGKPDDMKLRSSMTLFAETDGANPVFRQVLDKFFDGQPDKSTLQILRPPEQ
jgi:uncharacterized protein (DUF1810 family)